MPTLREIEADLQALDDLLMEMGGDVTEEDASTAIDQWLAEITGSLHKKLDGYATLMKHHENEARVVKEEIERLRHLQHAEEAIVKKLKERLFWFMKNNNRDKIQTTYHKLLLVTNGGKLPITITGQVPLDYLIYKPEPDMEKIRRELEHDEELPFARLEERGKHIRVS